MQFKSLALLLVLLISTVNAEQIKGVALVDTQKDLKRVAQGLRSKNFVLFKASVYVAQVFSSAKPDVTDINKMRESLEAKLPLIVTMTFVRNLDSAKIINAYTEVFKKNDIKVESEPFAGLFSAIKSAGDIQENQVYEFSFRDSSKDKFEMTFRTHNKDQFTAKDLSREQLDALLKMWFGKTSDDGMVELQNQFLHPIQ